MEEQILKRDPYNHKVKYENWLERTREGIRGVSEQNSALIIEFMHDMELGKNVSPRTKKGERSYIRLNTLRDKLTFFVKKFNKDLNKITKDEAHQLFSDMRKGIILKEDGQSYKGTSSFVKDFKVFWNWMRRTGKVIEDITQDLSRVENKPAWVYLSEEQFKTLANRANSNYRALIWFMYDSGMRVTEAYSIKVSDFDEDFSKLTIRQETSKTFGRKINLKFCSALIKEYISFYNLKSEDFLFQQKPSAFNKYLKNLAKSLFGEGISKARAKYTEFTLYDIRHNASCIWLKRYEKTRGLMYRMGWSKEEQVKYYSEFLGLSDELSDEDMVTAEDKTKLQKLERENISLKEQMNKIDTKQQETEEMLRRIASQLPSPIQIPYNGNLATVSVSGLSVNEQFTPFQKQKRSNTTSDLIL